MTQEDLATAVGIHPSTLGRIERGKGRVGEELLTSICNVLGESSDEVIQGALDDLRSKFQKKRTKPGLERAEYEGEPTFEQLVERFRTVHEELLRGERELRELLLKFMQLNGPGKR